MGKLLPRYSREPQDLRAAALEGTPFSAVCRDQMNTLRTLEGLLLRS